jgi:sigma-E factor negative regulatory protein RseA
MHVREQKSGSDQMNSGTTPQTAAGDSPGDATDAEVLSAWLDGELDGAAAEPVVARLLRQRDMQQQYQGWCLVGDALRSGEVLAGHSPHLCARINSALADEPALLAPSALPPRMKRHLASGFAVAAAAAVLVFVAVPQLRGTDAPGNVAAIASGAAAPASAPSSPAAGGADATTPVALTASGPSRDPRLDPYFRAHRDFMGAGVMPAAAVYLRSGNEGER